MSDTAIKLIVGLGNPGREYGETRHNAGFWFLDGLVARAGGSAPWVGETKFHGLAASCEIDGYKLLLLKPQTYMNRSGMAVSSMLRYFKLVPGQLLVVHDELDLTPGIVRLKCGGGHAGHNGLRDIIAQLGGNAFYRLRVGIGRPPAGRNVADYVLSPMPTAERREVDAALEGVYGKIGLLVEGQYDAFMNGLHR